RTARRPARARPLLLGRPLRSPVRPRLASAIAGSALADGTGAGAHRRHGWLVRCGAAKGAADCRGLVGAGHDAIGADQRVLGSGGRPHSGFPPAAPGYSSGALATVEAAPGI